MLVPRAGFEPATSPLGGVRSIQLSYRGMNTYKIQMVLENIVLIDKNDNTNGLNRKDKSTLFVGLMRWLITFGADT